MEALGDGTAAKVVNYIGLAGLIASFFSIIYAYSRQLFALSRAGYLPRALSVTNKRKAPTLALIIPGVIGFILSLDGQGDLLLNMAVFGAALSYVLMMVSHIVLRVREPNMARPYRTPGGAVTTGFALVIAVLAVIATFLVNPVAAGWCLAVFAGFMLYFAVYSRHKLVANSPMRSSRCSRRRRTNCDDLRQQVSGVNYAFDGLVEVMAKATPLRSGDQLAGCAAEHDAERAAAAWVLADLPLETFLNTDLVDYDTDEVTRLIMDSHDRQAFSPISSLTVGGLRDWLLEAASHDDSAERIAAIAPGLTRRWSRRSARSCATRI